MLLALGFGSYYYLLKGLYFKKYRWFILSGLLTGLAVFTHLNGLIFSVAGFILILTRKNLKALLTFSFFSGIATLLYFFDINSFEELKMLQHQLFTDPNVLEKDSPLISLFNEHQRFFWDTEEVVFSLLFFSVFIVNFNKIRKKTTRLANLFFDLSCCFGFAGTW